MQYSGREGEGRRKGEGREKERREKEWREKEWREKEGREKGGRKEKGGRRKGERKEKEGEGREKGGRREGEGRERERKGKKCTSIQKPKAYTIKDQPNLSSLIRARQHDVHCKPPLPNVKVRNGLGTCQSERAQVVSKDGQFAEMIR